ncbi:MAG: hypothetical protein ACLQGP_07490 [Isosphaeraceae bacterium]
MSVNDCGRVHVYQWLQFLSLHVRRYVAQVTTNARAWEAFTGRLRP